MNNDSPSPSRKLKTDGDATVAFELSRELTHAEIWNDSVLIDAWEAVHEEYAVRDFFLLWFRSLSRVQAYHEGDTALKTNPTKRSPLYAYRLHL